MKLKYKNCISTTPFYLSSNKVSSGGLKKGLRHSFLMQIRSASSLLLLFSLLMISLPLHVRAQDEKRRVWAEVQENEAPKKAGNNILPSISSVAASTPPGCTAGSTTNFSNITPLPIPDNNTAVTSQITVSGVNTYLWDIDVQTFITHTFPADLDMTIQSPSGTVVTLTTDNGGTADNVFNGTIWDDDADPGPYPVPAAAETIGNNDNSAPDHLYVNNIVATPLAPEEALAAFRGENPNGTWTLTLVDDTAGIAGSLNSWNLSVTAFTSAPVETTNSFTNTTPVVISSTGNPTITSTINVSGLSNVITKTTMQTAITHTFSQDLIVMIQSPAGTTVTLASNPTNEVTSIGNLDDIYNGTVWDDDANPGGQIPYSSNSGLATDHPYTNNVVATPLAPTEALGAFMGEDPNGTWTLTIADRFNGDGGSLNSWGLNITTGSCAAPPADFGDAPDPTYPTLLASNGARHAIVAGFSLGATVDGESDGNPSSDATGDGADEDGVTIPNPMTACVTTNINVSLTNTAGLATPRLDAWIDFNRDGDFNDAGEQIATSLALVSGAKSVPVNVPCGAVAGNSFARFRLSSTGGLSPTGSAANGEVEDYSVTIAPSPADLAVTKTDAPDPVTAGNNIVYTIIVSNNGPGNATSATLTDALSANTTFQSITAPAGWICTTPAVNAGGTVSCANASLANGASATFVLVVNVNTGTANGTISNTATVSATNPDPVAGNNSSTTTTIVAEFVSPAPTGLPPKALLVKPAAGNTTAGGGVSDSSCVAPTGVTVTGTFANINQALGATGAGDTIYVCPKYTANLVVPYIEHVSLGFTNLSVVGISDAKGSRAVIAANPSTATSPTTQLGTNYIVQIVATGVNFGNFVVDGAPGGVNYANTGIFNGIVVRRSGAFVFNNTVQNIRTTDAAVNANGQGIAVFGAGSAGSPLEGGTIANPVNILNNVVQTYRSNGVNVSAGSSSSYAFVRGNYIIGNGANSGTVNQTGVQFQSGANGDVFNNRITRILDSVAGCSAAAFGNCSAGIRLNTTASSSANNLRVRFNLISNTQTGIFAQDVQYVSMTSNTISNSIIDGINLRGSAFNLGSNFSTINQNTIFSARRSGIFIGLVGGDASLGNNLTQNTIEDTFTGVANTPPVGNNTIPTTGATANTFISVNNFVGSASSGVNDVQNTNPLP